ncbi:hypothetical protein PQ472_01390 [Lacticaseibacillus pabuli]|uniref:Uncharacterized protein n=1 Tax=Lacticaseibacillus pabuli TaxID=3025672 RepID=A0ABY7WT12_9LACO|nr:hypothetical protein [Lacticaseibacillus sp. KACC 23028]WDF82924.1 hypothetical protein PQ472_01390 [Lacticaseibacillus sp. KACC 23028]
MKVYVLTFASPDEVASTVYAKPDRARKEFRNFVDQIMSHYDEASLDMELEDEDDHGRFFDGYGITVRWGEEEVVD